MPRLFLGFFAFSFLAYGLYCFVQPGALAEIAGVVSTSPTGNTELRAMYGGLQVAAGALALAALWRADLVHPALVTFLFLGLGLFTGRLLGALLDGGWSAYTGMGFLFEIMMFAGGAALLRQAPAEA